MALRSGAIGSIVSNLVHLHCLGIIFTWGGFGLSSVSIGLGCLLGLRV